MSENPELVADIPAEETKQEPVAEIQEAPPQMPVEAPPAEEPLVEEPAAATPLQTPSVKQPKAIKDRKPWPVGVRILMVFIAIILCAAMFVTSLAGTLVLNIRAVVSRDGISKIVTQLVSGESVSAPARPALAVGAGTIYLDESSSQSGMSDMLVDWAYDLLKESFGDELELTKEQVESFVQESTVKDFVADKAAGLVEDFYADESNTTITVEEITQLLAENKEVIEKQFGVVIDDEAIAEVGAALEESGVLEPIEENGLLGYIEQTMTESPAPDDSLVSPDAPSVEGSGGFGEAQNTMTQVKEIMNIVRQVTSYEAIAILWGAFVVLMVALFFVTRRSFPATLSQTGAMLMLTGVIFCVPTVLCKVAPAFVTGLLGKELGSVVCLVFHAAAVVNYAVLGAGFCLVVLSIVTKVIKGIKKAKALLA